MSALLTRNVLLMVAMGVAVMMTSVAMAADKPAGGKGGPPAPHAIIKTKFGDIDVKFFPDVAPGHVENFVKLAKSGFYNGTIFHRVIPSFMIQGGDPKTKDASKKAEFGSGGPGYTIKAEFNDQAHKRGILSMARTNDPDSAGSQFFIVVENSPFLDGKYTAFGEVVKGMGVADKIVNAARDPHDNPLDRIEITVTIVE